MQRLDSGDKGLEIGDIIKLQATNDVIVGGKVLIQKYAEAEEHIIKSSTHVPWAVKEKSILTLIG